MVDLSIAMLVYQRVSVKKNTEEKVGSFSIKRILENIKFGGFKNALDMFGPDMIIQVKWFMFDKGPSMVLRSRPLRSSRVAFMGHVPSVILSLSLNTLFFGY
jgi:hypothetical protein